MPSDKLKELLGIGRKAAIHTAHSANDKGAMSAIILHGILCSVGKVRLLKIVRRIPKKPRRTTKKRFSEKCSKANKIDSGKIKIGTVLIKTVSIPEGIWAAAKYITVFGMAMPKTPQAI